jgi:flagellar biosynthesis GTPase FlhF
MLTKLSTMSAAVAALALPAVAQFNSAEFCSVDNLGNVGLCYYSQDACFRAVQQSFGTKSCIMRQKGGQNSTSGANSSTDWSGVADIAKNFAEARDRAAAERRAQEEFEARMAPYRAEQERQQRARVRQGLAPPARAADAPEPTDAPVDKKAKERQKMLKEIANR